MSDSDDVAVAALHPLLAQLFTKHGFTAVAAESLNAFLSSPGHALLVFTEDPLRVKETLDLAVIVPELAHAFPGRFRVGVLLPESARQAQARYGGYVGAVDGLRNWDEYLETVAQLLEAPPARPPTIGIPVTTASGERHCNT